MYMYISVSYFLQIMIVEISIAALELNCAQTLTHEYHEFV